MRILGLTGSIGMGKTTAARMLRRLGVPVHDADAAVHALLGPGGMAVPAVAKAFPGVVRAGAIDRRKLGAKVFGRGQTAALRRLEAILHPMVRGATRQWVATQARRRARVVVLDVPLLFESGPAGRYDAVIVVSAPGFLQRQRVLRRPGMTAAKLCDILAHQMPDAEKRRLADRVVTSGLGRRATWLGLRQALRHVRRAHLLRRGVWRPGYR
jgi:dephospho-CoA kinase